MKSSADELKRRRAERMADPAYREIVKRAARWRWKRRKDEANAKKRAAWAALSEDEKEARRIRRREYERGLPEKSKAKARERRQRYYLAHKEEIRARQAAYYESRRFDADYVERRNRNNARYAERCRTDEAVRSARAAATRKWRSSKKGRDAAERRKIAKWESVAAEGPERIASYMKRISPCLRHEFAKWYQAWRGLIDTRRALGHIVQSEDETVGGA